MKPKRLVDGAEGKSMYFEPEEKGGVFITDHDDVYRIISVTPDSEDIPALLDADSATLDKYFQREEVEIPGRFRALGSVMLLTDDTDLADARFGYSGIIQELEPPKSRQ